MAFVPNWSPTAYYNLNDKVFYLNTQYELVVAGSTPGVFGVPPPSNPVAWDVVTGGGVLSVAAQGDPPLIGNVVFAAGTGISVANTGGGPNGLTITNTGIAAVPFSYNIYVSSVAGSDTNGDGTIISPFQTIGKAIITADGVAEANQVCIFLASGTYTENVFMNRANTFITGSATSLSTATVINGTVTIDMTSSLLPFVIGGLSSVQVRNINHVNSQPINQSFLITDCLIAPTPGFNAISISDTSPSGGTGDITIQSCLIYMSDFTAVVNTGGFATFINTEIKNNPLVTAPASLVQTNERGIVNFYGCILTQASPISTVSPIVNITNNAITSTMVFYNTRIQYTSTTSDAGTGGKCCIRCANTAAISIVLFNNLLQCQGATTTNGTPGQFVVLQRTGVGTVVVNQGQNSGGTTANHLPANGGGFTKVAFVNVA